MNYSDIFVHTIYIYTWIFCPIYLAYSVIQLFLGNYIHALLVILYRFTREIYPAKRWKMYQKFICSLNPSNYYLKCSVSNLPQIKGKTMLCYHPHGIFCGGFSWNGAFHQILTKIGITWLVTPVLFQIPIFADLISWMGFSSIEKKNMMNLMKANKPIALLPGGFQEVAILKYNVDAVYVPFGFIKLALKNGYQVVPAYTFGECKAYRTKNLPLFLQKLLVKFKLPAVIFWGKFLMYPDNNIELNTVFGKPIECPQIDNPTNKQVHEFREKYIQELLKIGKNNQVEISIVKYF